MLPEIPTILILAIASAGVYAQDEKAAEQTRRYDVRALAAVLSENSATFPFVACPARPGGAGESAVQHLWGDRGLIARDPDAIAELVGFALAARAAQGEPIERISVSEGWLKVAGSGALQEQVPQVLSELYLALSQTIELELSVLPAQALAETSSAVLDPAMTDRLLSAAKPLATMRTRVRAGSETLIETVARRAYVKDYDTEVAQSMKTADPLIDVLAEGTRVSVRVDPAPGGRYVLAVRGQEVGMNGPPRTQMLFFQTPGTLQLPRLWWGSTSASGRVEDRGALVVGNDLTPRSAWAIRVLGSTSPKAPDAARMRALRLGAAIRPPMQDDAPQFHSPNPSGADAGTSLRESTLDVRHRLNPDAIMEQVASLRPDGVDESACRARKIAGLVALAGDDRFVAAASALVARLVDDATRGFSFEVRFGTVPAEGFVLPARDEMSTLAAALPRRASTAGIAGDRVVLFAGEGHAYLKDRDVEIAHSAAADDPIVDVFTTGLSMSVQALPAGEGRCSADVSLEYQELIELLPVATGSTEVPETELPRIAGTVADVPLDVPLGSWTLVHSGPLEGTGSQVVVMIRVTQT